MAVRYTRLFHYGDQGSDVEGVGRALARSHTRGNTSWVAFAAFPQRWRQTWGPRKQHDLTRFKKAHHLVADSAYTKQAHAKLEPYFDAKARKLMAEWSPPHPEELHRWLALVAAMRDVHAHTPGYQMGGSHGIRLSECHGGSWFDCSSSTSYVLYRGGMFPHDYAWDSTTFATSYGAPGRGRLFTVWAKEGALAAGHVWIQIHRHSNPILLAWRFDTSPQGDPKSPKSGARLRYTPRLTTGFVPRHWPGM